MRADGRGAALGFGDGALALGRSQCLDALPLDFGLLERLGDQFLFVAHNLGFLNLDFVLFLDLLDFHCLRHHLLLHDVGLNVVGLVRLRLLLFNRFLILRFLDLEIALRLGLLGGGKRFCKHSLLVRLGPGDGSRARCFGPLDGGVTLGFGGGDVGIAFDANHVGPAHVGDVVVLVTDFLDGERDHVETHLVHVVGAGGAHPVTHHFRLFNNLLHRKLADDAAQVALHHQPDQAVAFRVALSEELLGGSYDRLRIGLHLDLRHSLDRDRDTLHRVQVLLRRDVEGHQLQG